MSRHGKRKSRRQKTNRRLKQLIQAEANLREQVKENRREIDKISSYLIKQKDNEIEKANAALFKVPPKTRSSGFWNWAKKIMDHEF